MRKSESELNIINESQIKCFNEENASIKNLNSNILVN